MLSSLLRQKRRHDGPKRPSFSGQWRARLDATFRRRRGVSAPAHLAAQQDVSVSKAAAAAQETERKPQVPHAKLLVAGAVLSGPQAAQVLLSRRLHQRDPRERGEGKGRKVAHDFQGERLLFFSFVSSSSSSSLSAHVRRLAPRATPKERNGTRCREDRGVRQTDGS